MIDCKCGKAVRLGANRLTINRKRAIYHYIVHVDGTLACGSGWNCIALKPYAPKLADRPYSLLVERWERENASLKGADPK